MVVGEQQAVSTDSSPVRRRAILGVGVGVASGVVGLSPWLASGARLPLQNLWAQEVLPDEMPLALLPVSQYYVSTIAALLVVGGLAAGLAARSLAGRGVPAVAVAVGLLAVHALAVAQSFVVLGDGLTGPGSPDPRARLYLLGMLVGTVVAVALALVAWWLTSRGSVGPVAVGLLLGSVPLASWVTTWSSTLAGPALILPGTVQVARWLPGVVVAATLVWVGVRPARRLGLWVLGVVVLLVVPPLLTALTSGLGTRSLQGDPRETVAYSLEVLRAAVGVDVIPAVAALVGAAVVTAAVAGTSWGAARGRSAARQPERDPYNG